MQDFREKLDQITTKVYLVNHLYEICAKEAGLTFNAYKVYFSLDVHAPCTQKDICSKWGLPKQSVNFVVKKLEDSGCVEIVQGRNKKEKLIALTDAGREEIKKRLNFTREVEERILARIGSRDVEHFLKTQDKFIYNFTKELVSHNLLLK